MMKRSEVGGVRFTFTLRLKWELFREFGLNDAFKIGAFMTAQLRK